MKHHVLLICGLILILSAIDVSADCPEPDISTYRSCTSACPDPVAYPLKSSECANSCISSWNKIQDVYYACKKAEREQAEQKKIEEQARLATEAAEKKHQEELAKNQSRLSMIKGEVVIVRKDGTSIPGKNGATLQDGDTVTTGENGYALINFPNGHGVTLGPDSSFKYNIERDLKQETPRTHSYFELLLGRLRYKVMSKFLRPGEVIVGTGADAHIVGPGGTASIRGTDLIAEYDPITTITRFYLHEGRIDVNNTKGEVTELSAGETITLYLDGKTVKGTLTEADWNGLVNSIETGQAFIPSEKSAPRLTLPQETVVPGAGQVAPQRTNLARYLALAAIALVIIIILLRRKAAKRSRGS